VDTGTLLRLTIFGLATGSVYAVVASGLVLTYATSGIFNFAHGAIGMIAAFLYWELRVNSNLPAPVALVLVILVFGPLMGVLVERLLIRPLRGAPLAVTLVATVGLLAGLIGIAQTIWAPASRVIRPFFDPEGFVVGGAFVSWHRAITVIVAVVVAVGLRLLLHHTRTGISMRALVDDPEGLALSGTGPARASMLSWALGASLASVGGILIAPILSLDAVVLTLLVVSAYAAAVIGGLKSIPMTFVGAMIIGLLQSYAVQYVPQWFNGQPPEWLAGIGDAIPVLLLFVALLLLPQTRLRTGSLARKAMRIRVPSLRESLIAGGVLVAVAWVVSGLLSSYDLTRVGQGLALGLIVLSLVPLTGFGGQVSLCQLTFAGLGAVCVYKFGGSGSPLGLLLAIVIPGAVGALIALPALRLSGLYLALSTLAFAVFMDTMVFPTRNFFWLSAVTIDRLKLPGISLESNHAWFVVLAVAYALLAVFVLALRRSPFGRQLVAMRDSPAACATLGLGLTRTKLAVFSLSAAMAGLGGALFAGLKVGVTAEDFTMSVGLSILLLGVIGGIETASGPLVAGLIFAGMTILAEEVPSLNWIPRIGPAAIAIGLAFHPNGVVVEAGRRYRRLKGRDHAQPRGPARVALGWSAPTGPAPAGAGNGNDAGTEAGVLIAKAVPDGTPRR
jgi:branched-chain amino acid transport system permease protein